MEKEPNDEFAILCGEYVSKIENGHMDDLWCNYMKVRADPMATRIETAQVGNEFVRELNRLGISVDNDEDTT